MKQVQDLQVDPLTSASAFFLALGLNFSGCSRTLQVNMSHRGPLTAAITTVLGAALGGLLIWRVYKTKRKRLPSVQKVTDPVEAPRPVQKELTAEKYERIQPPPLRDKEFKTVECQTSLLGGKPVMVSSEEDWQRIWPLMQEELSVFPVLGLDCEWVKAKGVRNTFCMNSTSEKG